MPEFRQVTFLTAYFIGENNEIVYCEELQSVANYLMKNEYNVYLLDILRDTNKVAYLNKNSIVKRKLNENKILHVGFFGKPITSKKLMLSLGDYVEEFFKFLEKFNRIDGVQIINSYKTLKYNLSKQYILDYQDKFKFYETVRVHNFADILKYNRDKKKYLVKPLVSERGIGSKVLDGVNEEELKDYYNRYKLSGLIVQPYSNDFIKYGERKICFIKGECVLSRKVVQKGDEELVCHHSGSKKELYKPSKEELELGKKVYEEFSKKYDLSYYRLDVTSDRKNPVINEVEALNPDFCSVIYEKKDLEKYHKSLKEMFENFTKN